MLDRYGSDVLGGGTAVAHQRPSQPKSIPAQRGLVVEEENTGWVGTVIRVQNIGGIQVVELEDRHGRTRSFPLGEGFSMDGAPIKLVAQKGPGIVKPTRTASGSRAVPDARARVARGSRIWVEGKHDAELIEKVWGDDLRVEGVVVEELAGVDNLSAALTRFRPTPERRVGVLVDHLVVGTKEQRLAQAALQTVEPGTVLVLGHPYVDVWQAVKAERLGLGKWPDVDRNVEWKRGILRHLGWPSEGQSDIAQAWRRILATVRDYRDLDPALLGRVEELIDFVTA